MAAPVNHDHVYRPRRALFLIQVAVYGEVVDHIVLLIEFKIKASFLLPGISCRPLSRVNGVYACQNQYGAAIVLHSLERFEGYCVVDLRRVVLRGYPEPLRFAVLLDYTKRGVCINDVHLINLVSRRVIGA